MNYREGKMSVAVEAPPCPLCAGDAHWKTLVYQGAFGTGMEDPDLTLGCPECRIWLPQQKTSQWEEGKGTYSVRSEAAAQLLAQWSRRVPPGITLHPAATLYDRLCFAFRSEIRRYKAVDIAREMDVSDAYVSQLGRSSKLTLGSMEKVLFAIERIEMRREP